MFSFLGSLSPSLSGRYETLERNLRSASSSFFDAYLDLLEEFLRTVAVGANEEASPRATAGDLLRKETVAGALGAVGVADADIGKLSDYVLKINRHKHGAEKPLEVERAVAYLALLHRVTSTYAASLGVKASVFVPEYYQAIFNSYERENRVMREELSGKVEAMEGKLDEIGAYVRRMEDEEAAKLAAKRAAEELAKKQIEDKKRAEDTGRFLRSASRNYIYGMGADDFSRNNRIATAASLLSLALFIAYYIIFCVYQNAHYPGIDWGAAHFVLLVTVLVFVFHHGSMAVRAYFTFTEVKESWISRHVMWNLGPSGEVINLLSVTVGYLLWPILGTGALVILSIFAWVDYDAAWMLLILTPLISAAMFVARHFFDRMFSGFTLISYRGRSPSTGEPVTLYFSILHGKYMTKEECRKTHPWLFSK